jgi:hypothetical protein
MKKFLTAFTVLATSFANSAIASTSQHTPTIDSKNNLDGVIQSTSTTAPKLSIVDSNGDEQLFVLRRNSDTDVLMAYHESHSSHSSHSSHRSHYSSR